MARSVCLMCSAIEDIKRGTNDYFVTELKTGYVLIGWYQFHRGYTLFVSKQHVAELHELDTDVRDMFLQEMAMVAEAVYQAFKPKKLNYELLGNTEPHLHWHLFPRYVDDPIPKEPVWVMDKKIRKAESARPTSEELKELKEALQDALAPR
jgi:diadenosine tetraphosphate (Ap4A) HIT family hydrolase